MGTMEDENGPLTEQTFSSADVGSLRIPEKVEAARETLQRLLTVDETAKICRVSAITIRRAIKSGRLSHIRISSRILLSREGIGEFLEACKVPADALHPRAIDQGGRHDSR
jgi:excisionase family DNA binding protein